MHGARVRPDARDGTSSGGSADDDVGILCAAWEDELPPDDSPCPELPNHANQRRVHAKWVGIVMSGTPPWHSAGLMLWFGWTGGTISGCGGCFLAQPLSVIQRKCNGAGKDAASTPGVDIIPEPPGTQCTRQSFPAGAGLPAAKGCGGTTPAPRPAPPRQPSPACQNLPAARQWGWASPGR